MSNRRPSTRLLTRTLIIALLLAVVLVAVAPAAFANGGPSCKGDTCLGKAPQAMGCSHDAITLVSKYHSHQTVELRFSPACAAFWSRVTSHLAPGNIKFTRAGIRHHIDATRVVNWGGSVAISKMWTRWPWACGVSVSKSNPNYVPVRCVNGD